MDAANGTQNNFDGHQQLDEGCPLAFDSDGDPLDVPPDAVAWRVRKMAARAGRPKTIYDPETGRQLEIPLTATVNDLADAVADSGRYRLEAVDREGRHLRGCVAVTEVVFDDDDERAPKPTVKP